jgi:hypothetical protein
LAVRWSALVVLVLSGCGRLAFDSLDGIDSGPRPDAQTILPCGLAGTAIGDACADGTIYAGSIAGIPRYVTRCDVGRTWDGTTCVGTRTPACFSACNQTGELQTGVTDLDDGPGNTAALVALDADTVTPGFQAHEAATICDGLTDSGHSDWYLPAKHELDLMHDNRIAIGQFQVVIQARMYSSTEATSDLRYARFRNFFQEEDYDINKWYSLEFLRCMRR